MSECPCGRAKSYEECCFPYIQGGKAAENPESLMRSRYTAFVKGEVDYILETHHPETKHELNPEETQTWSKGSDWKGLDIKGMDGGQEGEDEGSVEFVCKYAQGGQDFTHHEMSEFRRLDGKWYFYDGKIVRPQVVREGPKLGRNDPCACGSGKKYKKCCLT